MHEFLEFTIIGIVLGAAYAVAASGLVVTYATSGIFNIAHGAIGMTMAFVYWQLSVGWHINTALSFGLTVFVLAPLLGAIIERGVIQWMDPTNVATALAVTVGLTLLLFGLVNNVIWKPTARVVPQFFGFGGFNFLGVHIDWEEVITVAAAVLIAIGLRLFLFQTRTGIAMRGVVDNRSLIGLFGGRPSRLSTLSWAMGASLASVAGILVAPKLQLQPLILTLLVIDAYAAAVIGRLNNLPRTFLGALFVGLASSYVVGYIPASGSFWTSTPVQGLGALGAEHHSLRRRSSWSRRTVCAAARHSATPRSPRPASCAPFRAGSCSSPRSPWPSRSWGPRASSSSGSGWPSASCASAWCRSPVGAATRRSAS